jgi:hypothetical protein
MFIYSNQYWNECKQRLEDLSKKIDKYTSKKLPVLFTYFADTNDMKESLFQVKSPLFLKNNRFTHNFLGAGDVGLGKIP